MTAHWGIPDPAEGQRTPEEIAHAFHDAFLVLDRRIARPTSLPIDTMSDSEIKTKLEEIGRS